VKSNPVSYTLKKDFTAGDVDRIFDSMRRRARAAFTYRWESIKNKDTIVADKIKKHAEAVEKTLGDSWGYCKWVMASDKGDYAKHELVQIGGINAANKILKLYEEECFKAVRDMAWHKKAVQVGKKSVLGEAWTPNVRAILLRVRSAYPWVTSKNLHRLAKAIQPMVIGKPKIDTRDGYVVAADLLAFGIPAAEIAGPWYDKKKFKSPVEWVRNKEGIAFSYLSSETMRGWMNTNGLDENDRQLRDSIKNYFDQHRAAPSVAWARRRQNELEEERTQKDLEAQLTPVEEWLESSYYWRHSEDVTVPPMPDPTFHVLCQGDAELLCRMAKRDGLCVVDAIIDMVNDISWAKDEDTFTAKLFLKAKREGFVTLIISTDPKRRTVVGLNEHGFCTSEHHCTGIQNKVDVVAYEYFKKH
jgi:hypothetical protein